MSSGDFAFGCGCFSFAPDCRTPGSGGRCAEHQGAAWTYAALWEANRRRPEWSKKNWGATDRPWRWGPRGGLHAWTDAELAAELGRVLGTAA